MKGPSKAAAMPEGVWRFCPTNVSGRATIKGRALAAALADPSTRISSAVTTAGVSTAFHHGE